MLFSPTMLSVMEFLQRRFSPVMIFLLVGCGLMLVVIDNRMLSRQGLSGILVRMSGWLYLIGGPIIYLWIRIYFYFAP